MKARKSSVSSSKARSLKRKPIPTPKIIWIKGKGRRGKTRLITFDKIKLKRRTSKANDRCIAPPTLPYDNSLRIVLFAY